MRAVQDLHRRQRRERRLLRRLPDHRIAAGERQRRVPGEDRDREIEGGDDGARAHRMPGLVHAMAGALGGDGEPVQLPRQADGEIADVDHLLHFAEALGDDLAGFERDQRAERLLRRAQFLAPKPHELAPPWRREPRARRERRCGPVRGSPACRRPASLSPARSRRRRSASGPRASRRKARPR